MPNTPFPGNELHRVRQTFAAGVTASSAATVVGNTTGYASLVNGTSTALIDMLVDGPSAMLILLMDGIGTATHTIKEVIYGVVEEDAQSGGTTIVYDPIEICAITWTINAQAALGYTPGSVVQADVAAVTTSAGSIEATTLGIGPTAWPSAALQGRAGVCIPRVGVFRKIIRSTWVNTGGDTAYPKHCISVVI